MNRLLALRVFTFVSTMWLAACSGGMVVNTTTSSGAAVGDAASGPSGGNATNGSDASSRGGVIDAGLMIDAGPLDDGGPIGDTDGARAAHAIDLLESIGVATHVGQGVDDPMKSATAMAYAGLHNLRDDGRPGALPGWRLIHEITGARVCLLPTDTVAGTINLAKQLHESGALLAVEGPNEPNNFPVSYEGQMSTKTGTFMPVARFQRDLYAAVKADPSLSGIPVFHSSEAGGASPDNVGLQFLTIPPGSKTLMPDGTKYADFANVHNYVVGLKGMLVDNNAWNASDPTLNGDWDSVYAEYGVTWNKKFSGYSIAELEQLPRVTTETGWVTKGNGALSEEQQARLFLNLYLAAFSRGFTYTFIYMLRDDPKQGYWGLFDVNYAPKRSGIYLHNLTTILADTRSRTPGKLDFSIPGPPETVHSLLLQKGNGVFELVVWNERHTGGADTIEVNLGASRSRIQVYDPTAGTDPTQKLENVSMVRLTLTDHPVVLEYDPRPAP